MGNAHYSVSHKTGAAATGIPEITAYEVSEIAVQSDNPDMPVAASTQINQETQVDMTEDLDESPEEDEMPHIGTHADRHADRPLAEGTVDGLTLLIEQGWNARGHHSLLDYLMEHQETPTVTPRIEPTTVTPRIAQLATAKPALEELVVMVKRDIVRAKREIFSIKREIEESKKIQTLFLKNGRLRLMDADPLDNESFQKIINCIAKRNICFQKRLRDMETKLLRSEGELGANRFRMQEYETALITDLV